MARVELERVGTEAALPPAALLIFDAGQEPRMLGASLVTLQLERARSIGIRHVVVLAAQVSQALLQDLESARDGGLAVDLARDPVDAAGFLHPDQPVLLIATAQRIIALEAVAELIDRPPLHLLCVVDDPASQHFERVDAARRWSGLAVINGTLARETAAMLGEWDFASTLARRALQAGASATVLPVDAFHHIAEVESAADALATAQRLLDGTTAESGGWATTYVTGPLGRAATRIGTAFDLSPRTTMLGAFGIAGAAVLAALAGWIAASLALLLIAGSVDQTASITGRASTGRRPFATWHARVQASAGAIVMLAMGMTLMFRTSQWGCAVLGLILIGATLLAAVLLEDEPRSRYWRADMPGHAIIGLAGLILGAPVLALALATLHALGGFIYAHRALFPRLARP